MNQEPNPKKTNIYDINEFTDQELLNLLDLHSPSDRELEAKIIFFIDKYRNTDTEDGDKLTTFFENVYERFFESSDQEEDDENDTNIDNNLQTKEGFTNATSSMSTNQTASASGSASMSVSTPIPTSLVISNLKTGSSSDILPTSVLDIKLDNQNPILKQTIKRIITVDSSKRTKHTDNANTRLQSNAIIATSTDFTFLLSEPLKDVVSIKLYAVNIPYTWYTISNSYGSNFFYIKGNTDGINNGNHDYKVEIAPGNYSTTELISAVNTSIQNLNTTYSDVNFGNSSITYNSNNVLSTLKLDINNQYNESSYYFQFPTTDASNTLSSFLGFDSNLYYPNNQYYPYKIKSNTFVYDENKFANIRNFTIDNSNNYFTIYKYIGPSSFDLNTSVIDLSFNVYFSLPNGFYTSYDLLTDINAQISNNQYLNSTYSYLKIITPGITSLYGGNSYFELSLKLNRYTTKNTSYSNLAIVFPQETSTYTVWTGGLISSFNFKQNVQLVNNIISDQPPPNYYNTYTITTSPYIKLQCTHPLYDSSSVNFYKFDISNATYNTLNDYIASINQSIVNVNNSTITPTDINGDFYIPNTYAVVDSSSVFNYQSGSFEIVNKFRIQFDLTKNINQKSFTTDLLGTFLYDLNFNRINDLSLNNSLGSAFSYSPTYTFNENTVLAKFNTKIKNTNNIFETESGITPKAFTGNTYVDSSGTYDVSYSSYTGNNYGWKLFTNFAALNSWITSYNGAGSPFPYTQNAYDIAQSPAPYVGGGTGYFWMTSVVNYGGISGEWVQIKLPYYLKMTSYTLLPRYDYNWQATFPNKFFIVGSTNGSTWNFIDYQNMSNNINRGNTVTYTDASSVFNPTGTYTFQPPGSGLLHFTTGVDSYYNYFRLIITELGGAIPNAVCLSKMDISGVVSNTLTNNLTSDYYVKPDFSIAATPQVFLSETITTTEGTYTCSESSYIGGSQAYRMFNGFQPYDYWSSPSTYDGSGNYIGLSSTNVNILGVITGEWVQLQLPYQLQVTTYNLWPRLDNDWSQAYPTNFYVVGSNDGVSWNNIDNQVLTTANFGNSFVYTDNNGVNYIFSPPNSGILSFNLTNAAFYSYIRLIVNKVGGTNRTSISFSQMDINGIKYGIENRTKTVAYTDLADYVTNQFYNYTDPSGANIFVGTTLSTLGTSSIIDASLNININKYLTQNDYSIQFFDVSNINQNNYYVSNASTSSNYPNWLNTIGVTAGTYSLNNPLLSSLTLGINTTLNFSAVNDLSINLSQDILNTALYPDSLPRYTVPKPIGSPYYITNGSGDSSNNQINRLIQDISFQFNIIPNLTNTYVVLRDLGNGYLTGLTSIQIQNYTYFLNANYSSWFNNLKIDPTMINTSFSLASNNTSSLYYKGVSYSGIISNIFNTTNLSNQITITPNNNTINLIPYEDGVYSSTNTNTITITIPYDTTSGSNNQTYTFQGLLDMINKQFAQSGQASNSTISTIDIDGNIYINFNIIINKLYTAKDYYLTFYNNVDFLSFYNINNTLVNITWDTTLGWVLGFRVTPDYDLTPDTDYYSTHYISETDNVISIKSSATINTYLYNYFMICLDEYNLNRLNDGVVTITRPNTMVSLPSYANSSNYIRDPVTGNITYNTSVRDQYNLLTNNQLYSLTELINSANTNENPALYSAQPFVKDVFGIVPLKLNGLNTSQTYSEFGGTLQNQERSYFGPINIPKMTVRLISDKGTLIDLNGQDWSFSLLVEQLYKKELTSK